MYRGISYNGQVKTEMRGSVSVDTLDVLVRILESDLFSHRFLFNN